MSKIGFLITWKRGVNLLEKLREAKKYGFECFQMTVWDPTGYTDELAEEINNAVAETGVEMSTLWAGWSGPHIWNFTEGPVTLGIVPVAFRMQRAEELIAAARFATKIGVKRVATHAGFLPENINDPEYHDIIAILRYITKKYKELGVNFLFETGQETPVALLRIIEAIGLDNVGINLDCGNLICYGKANPSDAVRIFGKYVMDTHIKDCLYPTDGMHLGVEVKVGEGLANFPEVIKLLKEVGYQGNFVIEREITGEQQMKDILDTKVYLENILK